MISRRYGRIINIRSVTSVFGYAGLGPYCASRGGVKQLTMSLANRQWVEYLVDRIPLKRPGQPSDLEGAIVSLAPDASEYITGQTLVVDGGISTGATRATLAKKAQA